MSYYFTREIYELWRDANGGEPPLFLSLSLSEQDRWSKFAGYIEDANQREAAEREKESEEMNKWVAELQEGTTNGK